MKRTLITAIAVFAFTILHSAAPVQAQQSFNTADRIEVEISLSEGSEQEQVDRKKLMSVVADTASSPTIESVTIHPPVASKYVCREHPLGESSGPINMLGRDCIVMRYNAGPTGHFPSFYEGDGMQNKDWYGWKESLLAPFDATVKFVDINPRTNQPGVIGEEDPSAILFERIDGAGTKRVQVLYAHVRDIQIQEGDTVQAGEPVARIGNDGHSWFPHVHIGAIRGDFTKVMNGDLRPEQVEPLQIRFDLAALGRMRGYLDQ